MDVGIGRYFGIGRHGGELLGRRYNGRISVERVSSTHGVLPDKAARVAEAAAKRPTVRTVQWTTAA